MTATPVSRRSVLQGAGALAGATALGTWPRRGAAQGNFTVGFIYVGAMDDFGYNQAHAEGAEAVKAMDGVTVIEEENVPESNQVEQTMQSMINFDGASMLFPTSFGYFDPHILNVAPNHDDIRFQHCGGLWEEGVHPQNVGSYFGYIGQGQYLNGITAGHATQSKRIGFVAAKPIPQVMRNINSYLLGARTVDPEIVCQVIFTGEWSMPVKEAEATNSLADAGCDVVTCHVDGPKVVMETGASRGMYLNGYHANQAPLAPEMYLTGAEWNWPNIYPGMVRTQMEGGSIPNFVRGGLADGFVKMSDLGPAVSDAARNQFTSMRDRMMQGGFSVFEGPIRDNSGNIVVEQGTAHPETAVVLERMDYLVEGVIGSTS